MSSSTSHPNPYRDEKPIGKVPKKIQPKTTVQNAISGEFFANSKLKKYYPKIIYCVILMFVFIGYNFHFRYLQRREIQTRIERDNERSRSMVYSSMRLNASRPSRIYEEVARRNLNLTVPSVPPKTIK